MVNHQQLEGVQKKVYFKDMHNILAPYLLKVKDRINNQDYDSFIVVVGKERRGKSTLAAQLGDFLCNDKLDVNKICMTADEFLDALKSSSKGDIIIFDEAGTNLYSREAMSTINRMLTKAFMISGLTNVCIILCIPNFFGLDSYIRQHRIDLLFYIPKRGKFKVYSTKRAKEISLKGAREKKIEVVRCNTKGWFLKQFPAYVEKEYRKKERKYKLGYIKDVKKLASGSYSTTKFAEITGYSMREIYKWIRSHEVKSFQIGGRIRIPKDEAERIIEEKKKWWLREDADKTKKK